MRKTQQSKLDEMFIQRWSPRSFLSNPIPDEDIKTIFEAARWSPSCFNEQPWRFVYAAQAEDLTRFQSALVEANQSWANSAPMLVYVFSKKHFSRNDNPNRWSEFDTGAAWMALTLQANKLGYHTHAMGGFDTDKAFEITGMDSHDYHVVCAIAIGKFDAGDSPDAVENNESPSARKALDEIVFAGMAVNTV